MLECRRLRWRLVRLRSDWDCPGRTREMRGYRAGPSRHVLPKVREVLVVLFANDEHALATPRVASNTNAARHDAGYRTIVLGQNNLVARPHRSNQLCQLGRGLLDANRL